MTLRRRVVPRSACCRPRKPSAPHAGQRQHSGIAASCDLGARDPKPAVIAATRPRQVRGYSPRWPWPRSRPSAARVVAACIAGRSAGRCIGTSGSAFRRAARSVHVSRHVYRLAQSLHALRGTPPMGVPWGPDPEAAFPSIRMARVRARNQRQQLRRRPSRLRRSNRRRTKNCRRAVRRRGNRATTIAAPPTTSRAVGRRATATIDRPPRRVITTVRRPAKTELWLWRAGWVAAVRSAAPPIPTTAGGPCITKCRICPAMARTGWRRRLSDYTTIR